MNGPGRPKMLRAWSARLRCDEGKRPRISEQRRRIRVAGVTEERGEWGFASNGENAARSALPRFGYAPGDETISETITQDSRSY